MSSSAKVLWEPTAEAISSSQLRRYLSWLAETRELHLDSYEELWRWSVSDLEGFWASLWDFFGIRASAPYEQVLSSREMPGARWFAGARLNYAEHAVGLQEDADRVAVLAHSQTRAPVQLTFSELREQVARARAGLQRLGVGPGDRVAAYLPNIPETLIAFLATASLGAIWATCAPEFGPRSVIARFGTIEPKLLLTVSGYRYGERRIDRRADVARIRAALPTLEQIVHVPYAGGEGDTIPDASAWKDLLSEPARLQFDSLPFDHPLCVLFSSGTTGLPKAIVHRHGGILIEHCKNHGLSWDLHPGDRLMWFSTTAWMMWNALISALLLRCAIVMIDGNPTYPDLGFQWQLAQETGATMMGASPAFLMACRKAGLNLRESFDLSSLRQLGVAGSPLPPEGFDWIYEQLGHELLLNVGSGGTDVCTGMVQGSPLQPVYRGEMSGCCLAVDAAAYDLNGRPVIGELGELVIRAPMPSMPIGFWNDPGDRRYRAAYFEHYPGVWRHGDWILFTERGSCVITGRSDATLNRGGVRLGTGELYAVVEELPEVLDSLVVHLEDSEGGPGELILFVVLAPGVQLEELTPRIAAELRGALSPRHVPDAIEVVPAIPRTLTQKKLELPVKRILQGARAEDVASRDALAEAHALEAFAAIAARRRENVSSRGATEQAPPGERV
ncbi:MAG: acetoacetate--CoA ligase [Solirubrobacterales bacterium]|nr:acetoacetate--CoA ligase [Solirubrobacterales bacterium]